MLRPNLTQRLSVGMVVLSLCATPSMAAPTSTMPASSRMIALSYLASDQSRAALCGNAAAATAAQVAVAGSAASGQAAPGAGCVLPAGDPVVAVPVSEAAPLAAGGGSLLAPLIAGLAGLVAVLVLINASNGDDEDPVPVSPS